jgi:hypothetical protein
MKPVLYGLRLNPVEAKLAPPWHDVLVQVETLFYAGGFGDLVFPAIAFSPLLGPTAWYFRSIFKVPSG